MAGAVGAAVIYVGGTLAFLLLKSANERAKREKAREAAGDQAGILSRAVADVKAGNADLAEAEDLLAESAKLLVQVELTKDESGRTTPAQGLRSQVAALRAAIGEAKRGAQMTADTPAEPVAPASTAREAMQAKLEAIEQAALAREEARRKAWQEARDAERRADVVGESEDAWELRYALSSILEAHEMAQASLAGRSDWMPGRIRDVVRRARADLSGDVDAEVLAAETLNFADALEAKIGREAAAAATEIAATSRALSKSDYPAIIAEAWAAAHEGERIDFLADGRRSITGVKLFKAGSYDLPVRVQGGVELKRTAFTREALEQMAANQARVAESGFSWSYLETDHGDVDRIRAGMMAAMTGKDELIEEFLEASLNLGALDPASVRVVDETDPDGTVSHWLVGDFANVHASVADQIEDGRRPWVSISALQNPSVDPFNFAGLEGWHVISVAVVGHKHPRVPDSQQSGLAATAFTRELAQGQLAFTAMTPMGSPTMPSDTAAPVLAAIEAAKARGASLEDIANGAGIDLAALNAIISGENSSPAPELASAIDKVKAEAAVTAAADEAAVAPAAPAPAASPLKDEIMAALAAYPDKKVLAYLAERVPSLGLPKPEEKPAADAAPAGDAAVSATADAIKLVTIERDGLAAEVEVLRKGEIDRTVAAFTTAYRNGGEFLGHKLAKHGEADTKTAAGIVRRKIETAIAQGSVSFTSTGADPFASELSEVLFFMTSSPSHSGAAPLMATASSGPSADEGDVVDFSSEPSVRAALQKVHPDFFGSISAAGQADYIAMAMEQQTLSPQSKE